MTTTRNPTTRLHFATSLGKPKCGRQLTAGLRQNARNSEAMALTQDPAAVRCRHCLRAMGLLAPLQRTERGEDGEDMDFGPGFQRGVDGDDEGEDE